MTKFDNNFFKQVSFNKTQVEKFLASAKKDLKIADDSEIIDVKFQFSYNALVKLGISLIALTGHKVASRSGHHLKILEKSAEILNDDNFLILGNKMRMIRNTELYDGGGMLVTEKQAIEYLNFVSQQFKNSEFLFKNQLGKLL